MWKTILSSYFKSPPPPLQQEELLRQFFDHPYHYWIKNRPTLNQLLHNFLEELPRSFLQTLLIEREVKLLAIFDQLSCLVTLPKPSNVVLVFPPLYRRLTSAAPEYGLAILAHEFGHLLLGHHQKSISEEQAQLEADQIAVQLGFKNELLDVLQEYHDKPFIAERIHHLNRDRIFKKI